MPLCASPCLLQAGDGFVLTRVIGGEIRNHFIDITCQIADAMNRETYSFKGAGFVAIGNLYRQVVLIRALKRRL